MVGIIIACSSHTPMTEILNFKLHLMQFIIHINSLLLTHIYEMCNMHIHLYNIQVTWDTKIPAYMFRNALIIISKPVNNENHYNRHGHFILHGEHASKPWYS